MELCLDNKLLQIRRRFNERIQILSTGSPKKYENWKTTWWILTDILERMKGDSIQKMNVICFLNFTEPFNRGLVYSKGRICEVKKLACLMFSGAPCRIIIIFIPTVNYKNDIKHSFVLLDTKPEVRYGARQITLHKNISRFKIPVCYGRLSLDIGYIFL